MIARRTGRLALALTCVVAAVSSCAPEKATPAGRTAGSREFEFGARRVQVTVPRDWEPLDQGQQKRFRKGEFEIVLQYLGPSTSLRPGPATPPSRDSNFDELVDWGLAAVGHNERSEVKSRRPVTVDGREAMDIETWNRLDHTNPRRMFFVKDDGDLLALHTVGMAFEDSLKAFESIRDSLHFVSVRR
jgi:hypothetical protein